MASQTAADKLAPMPEPETPEHLPFPPFVPLKGIPNFRDLGGCQVGSDGNHSVRRNYMFRCGEPTKATDESVAKICSLGVTHVFDLRSQPEIDKHQVSGAGASVINWPGVERVYCPVFPDESYDPVSLAKRYANFQDESPQGMLTAYKDIMTDGATAYATILRHMLTHPPPDSAFIFHCTAGKDRTGVLGALILSLCGVADEEVAAEYNLTEAGMGAWTEHLVAAVMRQGSATEAEARRMVGARHDVMLRTLEMVRQDYGGAQGYFEQECGLTSKELEKIHALLVVPEKPHHIVSCTPRN